MITVLDIALLPLFLGFIYVIAIYLRNKYIAENPSYRYFIPGLSVKVLGAIAICFIYTFYYSGGDTVNYFKGGRALINLLQEQPEVFFDIMGGDLSRENYFAFNVRTGWPPYYMYKDAHTFAVVRFTVPLQLLCAGSFLTTSLLLSVLTYTGVWKLYQLFIMEFRGIERYLAFGILFVPSVFFWGSGILKDSYTFAAACWFTFALYRIFINRYQPVTYFFVMLLSIYFMIEIKPYIFIALVPGAMLWLLLTYLKRIQSTVIRTLAFPFIMAVLGALLIGVFAVLGNRFGKYSLDQLVEVALITRGDLERSEQYGTNQFQLVSEFDGSTQSMLLNAPVAISTALFRPFLWEVNNPVMGMSALENFLIMLLVIATIIRVKPKFIFRIIRQNPLLVFSLLFAFFFAFTVGLTTANFGAMVRYRIPLLPFFLASFIVIRYFNRVTVRQDKKITV